MFYFRYRDKNRKLTQRNNLKAREHRLSDSQSSDTPYGLSEDLLYTTNQAPPATNLSTNRVYDVTPSYPPNHHPYPLAQTNFNPQQQQQPLYAPPNPFPTAPDVVGYHPTNPLILNNSYPQQPEFNNRMELKRPNWEQYVHKPGQSLPPKRTGKKSL